ncbi:hypothetical protein DFH07DRAFT_966958 [Mycena maculata]|uniref:Uncharacterized protein n=1 Tax=Mycena maculata TaxID=230809 RepID=A0AAD7I6L4_9AGAR|nr:hypothetical protein DFH07DRAFT_966958 [Mycena maculata]
MALYGQDIDKFWFHFSKWNKDAEIDYFTLTQKGANDARSDDLKGVTSVIGNTLNKDREKPHLAALDHTPSTVMTTATGEVVLVRGVAPLLHPSSRNTRGVEHDIIGGLLTSIVEDWNDPKRRVQTTNNAIAKNYFLRVFYEKFKGDPKQVEVGFLKSRYLVKVHKAIFIAPSSAEKDDEEENLPSTKKHKLTSKASRKAVADIVGLDGKVSGRSIGYAGVNLFVSLTNASQWPSESYYGVSLPQMYDFIVDFFEAPKPETQARERADALLAWWNKQIFPMHAASAVINRTSVDAWELLRAQRAELEPDEDDEEPDEDNE